MSDDCCCDSGGGGDSGGACDSGGNCDSGEPYDSGGHCGSGGNNDTVFNPADVPSYTAFDVSNSTTNGYFYNHDNDNSQNNTNSFGTGQETDMCNKCRAAPPNRKFPAHTSQNPSTFYMSIVQTTSKVLPNRTLANRRLLLPLPISQVSVEIHNHLDENQELSTTTTCERPQTVQKSAQQPKKNLIAPPSCNSASRSQMTDNAGGRGGGGGDGGRCDANVARSPTSPHVAGASEVATTMNSVLIDDHRQFLEDEVATKPRTPKCNKTTVIIVAGIFLVLCGVGVVVLLESFYED